MALNTVCFCLLVLTLAWKGSCEGVLESVEEIVHMYKLKSNNFLLSWEYRYKYPVSSQMMLKNSEDLFAHLFPLPFLRLMPQNNCSGYEVHLVQGRWRPHLPSGPRLPPWENYRVFGRVSVCGDEQAVEECGNLQSGWTRFNGLFSRSHELPLLRQPRASLSSSPSSSFEKR